MKKWWIGTEESTGGSYHDTIFGEELSKRYEGYQCKLYRFKSRFNRRYFNDEIWISDMDVINKIEEFIKNEDSKGFYEYIWPLVMQTVGVIEFIHEIDLKIQDERDIGFKNGVRHAQKEMRKVMGLEEDEW